MAKTETKYASIKPTVTNGHQGPEARKFYEKDSDIKLLKGKKIVVLGYGSQGHAQALNLKDSGLDVTVSVRKGGKGFNLALKHGWQEGKNLLTDNAAAVKGADWVH